MDEREIDRTLNHDHAPRLVRRWLCRCGTRLRRCAYRQAALDAQVQATSRQRQEQLRQLVLEEHHRRGGSWPRHNPDRRFR